MVGTRRSEEKAVWGAPYDGVFWFAPVGGTWRSTTHYPRVAGTVFVRLPLGTTGVPTRRLRVFFQTNGPRGQSIPTDLHGPSLSVGPPFLLPFPVLGDGFLCRRLCPGFLAPLLLTFKCPQEFWVPEDQTRVFLTNKEFLFVCLISSTYVLSSGREVSPGADGTLLRQESSREVE